MPSHIATYTSTIEKMINAVNLWARLHKPPVYITVLVLARFPEFLCQNTGDFLHTRAHSAKCILCMAVVSVHLSVTCWYCTQTNKDMIFVV